MTYRRVRLELARGHEHPQGSNDYRYEFVLPLDERGRLDRARYNEAPDLCTVHRFHAGEGDSVGQIKRTRGGKWFFSFASNDEERETIHRLADHLFTEGEYLTIRRPNGEEFTFKIVLNEPAPLLSGDRPVSSHARKGVGKMVDIRVDSALWRTSMLPEGILERWRAADGTMVRAGQPIAEIRIENALHELCAEAAGRLAAQAKANEIVEPGTIIGQIVPTD